VSDHTPARRRLLAVVAAAVGGGCLDPTASPVGATPDGSDVGPDWPTPDATTHSGYAADPAATVVVGDDDRRLSTVEPHQIVVTTTADESNDTSTPVSARVTTRVWRDTTRVVGRTDTLSPDRSLLVDLREQDRYLVAVRAARDSRGVVVSNRDRTWFDCNESATTVAVTPDGYERGFITTTMGCGPLG
jgi:hypothetical protein